MESIKSLHTFGLDIYAGEVCHLISCDDFRSFLCNKGPRLLLGGGSDVLFTCNFEGTIGLIRNRGFDISEREDCYIVRTAAGENWHDLVTTLVKQGIGGLENLALIPGTCGAAPVQNIGAYGSEFREVCNGVEIIDHNGKISRLTPEECQFGYRTSIFKEKLSDKVIISSIELRLKKDWKPNLNYGPLQELQGNPDLTPQEVFHRVVAIRKKKLPDPRDLGNAGSFFKNPYVDKDVLAHLLKEYPDMPSYKINQSKYKLAAGWLIDQAGLKGYRLNQAGIYQQQALILVNHGQAIPADICQVAKLVINRVYEMFGIKLIPEVRIIGRLGEISPEEAFSL